MSCNFTTTIDGKDLTFTSETSVHQEDTVNYKGELVQLEVGNQTTKTIYLASAFSSLHQVLHHFTESKDVNQQDTVLNVVAYYKKVLAGAVLTIPSYDINKMTVIAVINGTNTSLDSNNQVIVPFGATLSVKAVLKTGYQWKATQTTNYTPNGSDYVLDYNNGEATDTTKVLDGISSDTTLTNFFANIPEAEEILYNLTIDTGNTASVTGATITATRLTTITSPTISGNTIKVPHSYAAANCMVTIETTNATGYKSDDSSSNITWTNATTPVGGSYKKATYTFSSCADVTNVSVRYTADTIVVYYAFVQDANYHPTSDQNSTFIRPIDAMNWYNNAPDANAYYHQILLVKDDDWVGIVSGMYIGTKTKSGLGTATLYKFTISVPSTNMYFSGGNGAQQTINIPVASIANNKVYYAYGRTTGNTPNLQWYVTDLDDWS